jgi:hypothetical protein
MKDQNVGFSHCKLLAPTSQFVKLFQRPLRHPTHPRSRHPWLPLEHRRIDSAVLVSTNEYALLDIPYSDRSLVKAEPTETDAIGELIINSVKSQKENVQDHSPFSELSSAAYEGTGRKNTQPFSTTSSGAKRQRIASKVIDVEDEPRTPPSLRKISRGNTMQDGNECEKRILGEIENIR